VTPRTTPIEDILAGDEKAGIAFSTSEDGGRSQARDREIYKVRQTRNSLTEAVWEALRTLKK
jgi:hypothetical protein